MRKVLKVLIASISNSDEAELLFDFFNLSKRVTDTRDNPNERNKMLFLSAAAINISLVSNLLCFQDERGTTARGVIDLWIVKFYFNLLLLLITSNNEIFKLSTTMNEINKFRLKNQISAKTFSDEFKLMSTLNRISLLRRHFNYI